MVISSYSPCHKVITQIAAGEVGATPRSVVRSMVWVMWELTKLIRSHAAAVIMEVMKSLTKKVWSRPERS